MNDPEDLTLRQHLVTDHGQGDLAYSLQTLIALELLHDALHEVAKAIAEGIELT